MQLPSYCAFVADKALDHLHRTYHDHEYGFEVHDDNELFGRLLLEINQAGLSWDIVLKKRQSIRKAYADFKVEEVAHFSDKDIARLKEDAGIIRNRLKIEAAIFNAQQILQLQQDFGSFKAWLDHHHPKSLSEWIKLFKKNFRFTGGEITKEFLMSTGYVEGAHQEECPVYERIKQSKPPWMVSSEQ